MGDVIYLPVGTRSGTSGVAFDPDSGDVSWTACAGQVDYQTALRFDGGALLLGSEGIVVICHGRSESRAIGNAVLKAARFASQNVKQRIVEKIAKAAA